MTAAEFKRAFAIADDDTIDLSGVDNNIIMGYGLPGFQPVPVTLEMVAKEIRWHALMMNGKWNSEALEEVRDACRRAFVVVG